MGRFALCWTAIAIGWLFILPWIANRESVHAQLEELEAGGIDPSAMFYTELPVMSQVLSHMDRFHREHPQALWDPHDPSVAGNLNE